MDLSGFGDFLAAAEAAVERAVEHGADAIVDAAQAVVPVKTGFLRDSLQARPLSPLEWEVEAGADYASAVEFGTTKQGSQPYFTPAVEAERARFQERIETALAEVTKG